MTNKNDAIFQYIDDLVANNNLSKQEVASILKYSLTKAYNKGFADKDVDIELDFDNHIFKIFEKKKVVSDEYYNEEGNDDFEISLTDAKTIKADANIGDEIVEEVELADFDSSMIRTALQLFKQKINENNNQKVYDQWKDKKGTIITGKVEMTDPIKKFSFVQLENTKGFISAADKIQGENLETGKFYKFYVKDVREQTKGWPIILSRTDVGFIKELLKLEVPEVAQGIITIEAAARIAGFKTKIAVKSNNSSVDPIATCIGQRRSRVDAISRELGKDEKIEFLKYYDDPIKFIASACAPSRIVGVEIISEKEKSATIVCPNDVLSLIIGVKGKNISLIHTLTGWNLDVKSLTDATNEKINYTTIDVSFYDHNKNNKTYINQFASTEEILKNLEQASSYEEIEKTFDLKNNEMVGDNKTKVDMSQIERVNKKNKKEKIEAEENKVEQKGTSNLNSLNIPTDIFDQVKEAKTQEVKAKQQKVKEVNAEQTTKEPKKNFKIDYDKLRSETTTNIDSLEAMLDGSSKPATKKKSKNHKKNGGFNDLNKDKKGNVLDAFDDITEDFLDNDDPNFNEEDDDSSFDDYDSDDYKD